MFYADEWQPEFGIPYALAHPSPDELEKLSDAEIRKLYKNKLQCEQNAKEDPIQFGYTLAGWERCMRDWKETQVQVICGGNRSSKSSYAASLVVLAAMSIPEAKIRCYHVNEEKSIAEQQAMVWAALPNRFKQLGRRKGINYSIQYNQKNGFTSSKLILPPLPGYTRGSEILFCNYQQYKNDAQVAEGWWAHLIWCDEEMPQKLYETLQYRLIDARGRMILTFTTLNGWTPLVADLMARTKTIERRFSPILGRDIPVVQDNLNRRGCRIYYWWTVDNPFVPGDDFVKGLEGKPVEEILARAHGIPTRSSSSPFPRFDDTVHVIPHEKLPWLQERQTKDRKNLHYPVTFYHVIDPSGSKPWFMIWAAIDARDCVYIYREWPDDTYGAWADFGSDERGKPGPGQKPLGWGIREYVEHVLECEEGEPVYERYIDSRLGNAEVQALEGSTTIATELDEAGLQVCSAPGQKIDHGLQLINEKLAYDESKPISAANAPKLYISDRCTNVIFAMKNFTNRGGKDEACKDPIDCVRYLLEAGAEFVAAEAPQPRRTFTY